MGALVSQPVADKALTSDWLGQATLFRPYGVPWGFPQRFELLEPVS